MIFSLANLMDRVLVQMSGAGSGSSVAENSSDTGSDGASTTSETLTPVWQVRYAVGLNLSADTCPNPDGIWRVIMPGALTVTRENRVGASVTREVALCWMGDLPADELARERLLARLAAEIEGQARRWIRLGGPVYEAGGPLCQTARTLSGVEAGYNVTGASANSPTFAGGLALVFGPNT